MFVDKQSAGFWHFIIREPSDSKTRFCDLMFAVVESERTLYRKHRILGKRVLTADHVKEMGKVKILQSTHRVSTVEHFYL